MASKSVTKVCGTVQALALIECRSEPRVDSRSLAQALGGEHQSTLIIIDKYLSDFEEFGVCAPSVDKPRAKSAGGRPARYYLLNEDHANLLLTYSKNTPEAREIKKSLIRLFRAYKNKVARQAEHRASTEWQTSRHELKLVRRVETDHIKVFVDYAIGQGSKSAKFYYGNLTSMTYKALGFLELGLGENLREKLNIVQHQHLMAAESIVAFALHEGMEQGLHYKAIYQVAKERVVAFAKAMPPARFFDGLNAKKLTA